MAPSGESNAVPHPMLTVAAVARRLGVAPSTLRTWDRRYGIGPSAHTAGEHRRYGPGDLARLVIMRRLTSQGVPPADAAQIALSSDVSSADSPVASVTSLTAFAAAHSEDGDVPDADSGALRWDDGGDDPDGDVPDDEPAAAAAANPVPDLLDSVRAWIPSARTPEGGSVLELHALRPRRAGGGRVIAMPDGSAEARGLARAAMALDTHETTRLLREAVRTWGVVATWDSLVVPVLHGLGERWKATGAGVEIEHAFSEAVQGVMRAVAASITHPRNQHSLLLTCAEGDYHSLPLHVLAAALAEEEVDSRMLGSGMPPGDLVSAVRRTGPAAIFVYARLPVTDVEVLEELPRQRPAPRVVVGGPGWDGVALPRGVVHVDSLGAALDELITAAHL